jgi:hypothetical protein
MSVHSSYKNGKPVTALSHADWQRAFDPIDTTRPIAPRKLVRAMVISLAIQFGVAWRIDRKGARS